ncbi:MAG: DUF4870 domain-containing protein [Planctomycetes bacterium]|nr:DUF4870 domain-containing protein [Planctomycetota bacterium]NOG55244.1 DUF4870 domain-containing protein [Planctomycetota bacterium]
MDAAAVNYPNADANDEIPGTPADRSRRQQGRAGLVDANVTDDERTWATFIHLGGLATYTGLVGFSIIVPLILWLMKRGESPFIDDHGKEALNFQISMMIWMIVAGLSMLCFAGFILMPILLVVHVVTGIVNAVRANRGEYVRYPITIRFLT